MVYEHVHKFSFQEAIWTSAYKGILSNGITPPFRIHLKFNLGQFDSDQGVYTSHVYTNLVINLSV